VGITLNEKRPSARPPPERSRAPTRTQGSRGPRRGSAKQERCTSSGFCHSARPWLVASKLLDGVACDALSCQAACTVHVRASVYRREHAPAGGCAVGGVRRGGGQDGVMEWGPRGKTADIGRWRSRRGTRQDALGRRSRRWWWGGGSSSTPACRGRMAQHAHPAQRCIEVARARRPTGIEPGCASGRHAGQRACSRRAWPRSVSGAAPPRPASPAALGGACCCVRAQPAGVRGMGEQGMA